MKPYYNHEVYYKQTLWSLMIPFSKGIKMWREFYPYFATYTDDRLSNYIMRAGFNATNRTYCIIIEPNKKEITLTIEGMKLDNLKPYPGTLFCKIESIAC
jgi:hypothetical protein